MKFMFKRIAILFLILCVVMSCITLPARATEGNETEPEIMDDKEEEESIDTSEEAEDSEKTEDSETIEEVSEANSEEIIIESTNGHSQSDAVQWATARANEHWEINDGSGWTQCVEFLWAYYDYLLGYTYWDIRSFNANNYLYNAAACPSGWTRPDKSNAQPGDIVIWDSWAGNVGGSVGHIGVIIARNGDTLTTAEANVDMPRGACSTYVRSLSGVSGIIHPDFAGGGHSSPMGNLDGAVGGSHSIHISGWAFDADDLNYQADIHVYVGGPSLSGASCYVIKANKYRSDVNDAYGCGNYHGFDEEIPVNEVGTVEIYVYAINNIGTENNPLIGTATVTIRAEMASGYDRVLPDGDYLIASAGYSNKTIPLYLDIDGVGWPAASGTNVAVCTAPDPSNIPGYEIWTIKYSNGFYTIKQMNTDMSLDVQGASSDDGTNVMVHPAHGGTNQQWAISKNGSNGYRIQSKCNGKSLDVLGGVFESGKNVGMWTNNSTVMQSWLFIPYNPSQPISQGKYMMVSMLNKNYIMDVAGDTGNIPNGQNVQIWADGATTKTNEFEAIPLSNGYYKFVHVASGKVLDVAGGLSDLERNIQLWEDSGSIIQQWAIIPGSQAYCIVNRSTGMAVNFDGSKVADGTNISQYYLDTGVGQQNWMFVPAEYSVSYNMNGGSGNIPAQIKYYKNNLTLSSVVPTRSGYDFLGWSSKQNATSAEYKAGGTFTNDANTTLYAVWKKKASVTTIFKDVKAGQWYVDAIQFVYDRKIMTGTGTDTFSPNSTLTRGQFVTVLYSMENKPATSFKNTFTDVKKTDYYALPAIWAYNNGITSGTGNGKFSPNANITREQLAAMLYKYATVKNLNKAFNSNALDNFSDKNQVSSYAVEAMKWAVSQGIISGKGGRLDPKGNATRAECAAMVTRLLENNQK